MKGFSCKKKITSAGIYVVQSCITSKVRFFSYYIIYRETRINKAFNIGKLYDTAKFEHKCGCLLYWIEEENLGYTELEAH
jgi:hypothetical protein